MGMIVPLIYWMVVLLWLAVLVTIGMAYARNHRSFGAARLLLAVLALDTARNVVENLYFGLYFGGQFGVFPAGIAQVLGQPSLLVLPKALNVLSAGAVLGLLLLRWLPQALREHADAESNLDEAERRFGLLVDSVKEYAIYLLDPAGRVTSWNPGAERIKGYAAAEVIGSHVAQFYSAEDRAAGAPEHALSTAARDGTFEGEALRTRKDGTTFLAHVAINAIRDASGELVGFAEVTKDITEAKAAERRLQNLAHFDQLTGLPNRNSLFRDLDDLARLDDARARHPVCVALIDLDGFKEVNDTIGHAAGDSLLVEVARRLESAAKDLGRIYRLGGDEFVLLIHDREPSRLTTDVFDAMLRRLGSGFEIAGRSLLLAASAGVAIADEGGLDARTIIARADLAMYDAKAVGGNRVSWFQPAMRAKAQARQEIEAELQQAYCNGEFELYFQPQVRLQDGVVVGAEALLRWRHPRRGLLAPSEFIGALAQSSAAANVGMWILRSACEAAVSWREPGAPPAMRIGVNLFPVQFNSERLVQDVAVALQSTGLPPELLELEITENIALGRDEDILPSLEMLRKAGVGLAFDDFGTGFASLSYLSRYPLTRIKIDRSFVSSIGPSASSGETAIVRSLIAMGHNLGLRITAEGVETPGQSAYLADLKCDEAQGYYFAKPLPGPEFEHFLARRRTPPPVAPGGARRPPAPPQARISKQDIGVLTG